MYWKYGGDNSLFAVESMVVFVVSKCGADVGTLCINGEYAVSVDSGAVVDEKQMEKNKINLKYLKTYSIQLQLIMINKATYRGKQTERETNTW